MTLIAVLLRDSCCSVQRIYTHTYKYTKHKCIKWQGYLEISTLIERVRWTENRDFPLKHVVLINELYAKTLDGLLLQTFVLQCERPECATRWLCHIFLFLHKITLLAFLIPRMTDTIALIKRLDYLSNCIIEHNGREKTTWSTIFVQWDQSPGQGFI